MNNFNNKNNMFDDKGFFKFNNTIPGYDRSFENSSNGFNDFGNPFANTSRCFNGFIDPCAGRPQSFGDQYRKMEAENAAMCDFFNNSWRSDSASVPKKPEPFTIPPAAMPFTKRVTLIDGGKTQFGYFQQTDPSPYFEFQPTLIKGVFTNEITGEKRTVTVTDMHHDLTVWGVISYIFKIFNW